MTELFLIRHGNAKKLKGEGYVTAPLTELGRKQADATGTYFKRADIAFDGFYASPLKRAYETASIIGAQIEQAPVARTGIQEMEYREWLPTLAVELVARTGALNRYYETRAGQVVRHPLLGRISRAMTEILRAHPQGRVAVVVHGGVVSGILAWYLPRERQRWWRVTVGNCSITRLQIQDQNARVMALDEISHLGELQASAHVRNYTFSAQQRL